MFKLSKSSYYHWLGRGPSKKSINYSVLDIATDSIIKNEPLEYKSLLEYFKLRKELCDYFDLYQDLFRIGSMVSPEVDFFLLGIGFDAEVDEISFEEKTQFENLFSDFTSNKLKIDQFILKAKGLLGK